MKAKTMILKFIPKGIEQLLCFLEEYNSDVIKYARQYVWRQTPSDNQG